MAGSTVFRGGRVFTGHRWVDAVLIDGGTVVAAGTDSEVGRSAPTGTEWVELGGHVAIPGLIDAHLHLGGILLENLGVRLAGARSGAELAERCAAWAVDHPSGPVVGRGWDQELMESGRYPTRAELDRAFPDREVVLYRVCGHAALVNALVLEGLGITPSTDDPVGGRIARDGQGAATGLLFDEAMRGVGGVRQRLIAAHPEGADATLSELASTGLTTVASMSASAAEVREAAARGSRQPPKVRLRFYVELAARLEFSEGPREWADGRVRVSGVKAITDGSFGARTAWLSEPYEDRPDEAGMPVGDTDELAEELAAAGAAGLQLALHAIGDRALYRALRLLQAASGGPTPRIEHASLVPPNLYSLLDRVQPHLVVQPRFVVSDTWLTDRLGAVRARFAYPFRTLQDRGYALAGSSDAPVEPFDPWTGLASAVHRGDPRQGRWTSSSLERLSPESAFRLYTTGAGSALEEPGLGALEPGSPGDLVMLRVSTLDQAIAAGRESVAETWRDGTRVYGPA